jgi:YbgC/YbaW family acyl-CoA thioester hydrolase
MQKNIRNLDNKKNIYDFRVCSYECDLFKIVNNVSILDWFENGRYFFVEKILNEHPFNIFNTYCLSKFKCNYKSPAKYGDILEMTTSAKALLNNKIIFTQVIIKKKYNKIIAKGEFLYEVRK